MLVAIFTGSRAEWGLLKKVRLAMIKRGHDVTTIYTNQHLIEAIPDNSNDYIHQNVKAYTLLASDSPCAIAKSIALNITSLADAFTNNKFDYLIILGDRFESLGAAVVAYTAGIPIAHIHGGEKTLGSKDDGYRDCITRLSSIHFPAAEIFKTRIQEVTGGNRNIHYCGCLGTDGLIKRRNPIPRNKKFIYIANPPAPWANDMLQCLKQYGQVTVISPNPDVDYMIIKESYRKIEVQSFTREQFLDKLVSVDALVGNSSSGIIEAPALGVPSINIGDRQKGRPMAASVIGCIPSRSSLKDAINTLYSDVFRSIMSSNYKLYYTGHNVADKMIKVLEDHAAIS